MKLINLQIFPTGQSGWQSDLLVFGKNITHLYGPNGCGKTPIIQSIAFCLGYPCKFRNDIYDRCNFAVLNVETHKGNLTIKRVYSRSMDAEITGPAGNTERFYDEKSFSMFMFEYLDMPVSNLVGNNNKIASAYMSTILPIFYLDQDEGYGAFYCPPANFIRDQFSEMVRMLLTLPVRNSFDAKKDRIKAKEDLVYWDKYVETHSRQVNAAIKDIALINKTPDELTEKIKALELELEQLKGSGANHEDSINVFDRLISAHNSSTREISNEIAEIHKRSNGIHQIVGEINAEIETLSLNEEARRVFLSFNEICGSENCKLFSHSSDMYSKNLLYLKDQIKDLERNSSEDMIKVEELLIQKQNLENLVSTITNERNSALQKSEISALVGAISELKNQIFELQNQLSDIQKVEVLRQKHFKILLARDRALTEVQSYSSERSSVPELIKFKADLRQYLLVWLEQLHTINISRDITFKDDFTPVFGEETISQLKGSTRIRAVLAYHAALLELIAKHNVVSFRFIILDTPKQHEIHNHDLDRYLKALKKLCADYDLQIVFSTTEYHYEGDEQDTEWNPQYPGKEQKMFLASSVS